MQIPNYKEHRLPPLSLEAGPSARWEPISLHVHGPATEIGSQTA